MRQKFNNIGMLIVYNILLFAAALIIAPYYLFVILFRGKYRQSIMPKLGGRQAEIFARLKSDKRVWIHAVSVGEVTAAAPVIAALKQKRSDIEVILSTSTETGQQMARQIITAADAFVYFPLDFPCVVRKAIRQARPDVFALIETELWPNFLKTCKKRGAKILMVNGRISPRSYGKYRFTRLFWRRIFQDFSAAAVISALDAQRIIKMGMRPGKIYILGNTKYDALAARASGPIKQEISRRFNVRPEERFFVAGSTHPGEEEIIISVYKQIRAVYPDFKLIIVPRHIERTPAIIELLRQNGLADFIAMSEISKGKTRKEEKVVLVDVIGELFKIYSLATIVYCGGSLVPRGGQNILEAAAWGKVIFYGHSMDDFSEEKSLLESVGCGIMVKSADDLTQKILQALENPAELARKGARGREAVVANMGAAVRYAELIEKFLD